MPASPESSSSSTSFGFPILSRRRDQVYSMEFGQEAESESFQRQISQRLHDLASADNNNLLSISWIEELLDIFIFSVEEFRVMVLNNKAQFSKPPMDRYISDFFDRSVKALDICNAVRDGIEQMKQWEKHLEIVLCSLDSKRSIGEGHFRRVKKALNDLAIGMLDERESNTSFSHRNRSFGRPNTQSFTHFRSLSWSVSRSWSAARQLQAIGGNMAAPKTNEITSTNGLNVAVFTMNHLLLFVMWALVAAIPCQDRGLSFHFSIPRHFTWANSILSLHERILEESRKRERRNTCGLLKEIHEIEKCTRHMNELTDTVQFPLTDEKEDEVKLRVQELASIHEAVKDGLVPLERRIRQVFHLIVRIRMEGLDAFIIGK